jgi:hypothetical protein
MEKVKLTVRVDARWLEAAKVYAKRNGISLSRLISEYLRRLTAEEEYSDAPILSRLSGILPTSVSLDEYGEHRDAKYDG